MVTPCSGIRRPILLHPCLWFSIFFENSIWLSGNQGSILCNVEIYEAYFIVSSSPIQPNMSQINYKVYISILLLVINNSLYSLICAMSIAGRGAFLIILKCSAYLYVDSEFRWYQYFQERVKMANKHNQASFHLKCTNSSKFVAQILLQLDLFWSALGQVIKFSSSYFILHYGI